MVRATLAIALAILAGCETVPPVDVKTHEKLPVIPSKPSESKSVHVSGVTDRILERKIGQMKTGSLCIGGQDLVWRSNPAFISLMHQTVLKTIEENGYNAYSGLIQSRGVAEADVLIGAAITDVKANLCSAALDGWKGDLAITMVWEIYDPKTKGGMTLTTYGSASTARFSSTGDPDLYLEATRMATSNLLANREFHRFTRK